MNLFARQQRSISSVHDAKYRGGFTLVELLVVIAIIALLVAILLPAVNSARGSARRMQCKNHIRQLGLAVVAHHDLKGHFPVSQTGSGKRDGNGGCRPGFYSWLVQILPHIEEQQLHDSIDFKADMTDQCNGGEHGLIEASHANARAAATPIPIFLCPSDGFTGQNSLVMGSANPASDNYAGNAGWPSLATGYNGERETPGDHNGIIGIQNRFMPAKWHPSQAIRDIHVPDGLSKTAAIAERLIQRGNDQQSILNSPDQLLSFHITEVPRTLAQMSVRCDPETTHSDLQNSAHLGRSWISGWSATAPTYMHLKTPNTNHCHFGHSLTQGDFIVTPTSNHHGGVNVCFADAHVQFIQDDVDPNVWWAMGSRDEGDIVATYYR